MSSTIHTELTGKETVSDFEKLLDLAEELKDKCDNAKQRIARYRTSQFIMAASFIFNLSLALLITLQAGASLSLAYKATTAFFMVISVVVVLVTELRLRKINQDCLPDRRALKEVVGLLREVESVESKSPLERAYFRIRLSRFDIGY